PRPGRNLRTWLASVPVRRRGWLMAGCVAAILGFAALLLAKTTWLGQEEKVYLFDLAEVKAINSDNSKGHRPDMIDKAGKNPDGTYFRVNGAIYPKALHLNAPGQVNYALEKKYRRLRTTVAQMDCQGSTKLTFLVMGDGQKLWESKVIRTRGDSDS